jgi:hypothetical protein
MMNQGPSTPQRLAYPGSPMTGGMPQQAQQQQMQPGAMARPPLQNQVFNNVRFEFLLLLTLFK